MCYKRAIALALGLFCLWLHRRLLHHIKAELRRQVDDCGDEQRGGTWVGLVAVRSSDYNR